jgi:hypothetical protein
LACNISLRVHRALSYLSQVGYPRYPQRLKVKCGVLLASCRASFQDCSQGPEKLPCQFSGLKDWKSTLCC